MNSPTKVVLVIASWFISSIVGCTERSTEVAAERADEKVDQAQAEIRKGVGKAETAVSDAAITAKIKGALVGEPGIKAMQINVNTANGLVTLSGAVSSSQDSTKAQQIAQSVDGVKSVENRLVVKSAG